MGKDVFGRNEVSSCLILLPPKVDVLLVTLLSEALLERWYSIPDGEVLGPPLVIWRYDLLTTLRHVDV